MSGPAIVAPSSARWSPRVTVAAIVERAGRFLMVEEDTAHGPRINNPAGHLEEGESLIDAVVREVLEETGRAFVPTGLVGVYLVRLTDVDPPVSYLRFTFVGEVGEPEPGRALDEGIVQACWMTADELRACAARHRSPLLLQGIADHEAGRCYPLDLLHADASIGAPAAASGGT